MKSTNITGAGTPSQINTARVAFVDELKDRYPRLSAADRDELLDLLLNNNYLTDMFYDDYGSTTR